MRVHGKQPRCILIAGPNGAGKTTFAREFLPKEGGVVHFVNADLIAGGMSPLRPELAALASGRLLLAEVDRLAKAGQDFAFESTLTGRLYVGRLRRWKSVGYRIEIVFLRLASPRIASGGSLRASRKEGTMWRRPMFSDDSGGDGEIFAAS